MFATTERLRAISSIEILHGLKLTLVIMSGGRLLFQQIVRLDLEGIVCKRKDSPYKVTEKPSHHWIKVKNSRYSELEGREELFDVGRRIYSPLVAMIEPNFASIL